MATELICCLADIHGGGTTAVLPPGFVTKEGNEVVQNRVQEWLWQRMEESHAFVTEVADGDPMHLIVNGDAVEGLHHRTTQVISPDLEDHIRAAKEILYPWCQRSDKVFFTEGTECHTHNTEDALAKSLGAEKNPATQRHTFPKLDITIKGCPITAFHHMGTSARAWTAGAPLASVLANEQTEAAKNDEVIPKVVITAHSHQFRIYNDGTSMCVVCHPWQMNTRFCGKVVPSARTKPGVFLLDWRNKGHGELPEVHFRTFKAKPAPRIFL